MEERKREFGWHKMTKVRILLSSWFLFEESVSILLNYDLSLNLFLFILNH